jgi:hypothetical protein
MATAATVVGGAAGLRTLAAERVRRHLGERGLRWVTGILIALVLVASATLSGA